MKRSLLFFVSVLVLAWSFDVVRAQTVEVTVANQHVVGTDFIFDVYMQATVGTVYLGSCDLVLQFNSANFTSPAITAINDNSGDGSTFSLVATNAASVAVAYEATVSPAAIVSNEIIFNTNQVSFTSLNFGSKVAKLTTGVLYHFGNYTLSGITNPAGTMGLVWKTGGGGVITRVSTLQSITPFAASTVTLSTPAITNTPLPVEMTNCTAAVNHLNTSINWTTATETNNFGFDVERKATVGDWTKVGFVAGAGTSSKPTKYSYLDQGVTPGSYEYRIKQIDKSGSFKYSTQMQVEVGLAPKVLTLGNNYPNPFNPTTNIEFTLPKDGRATLKVFNSIGQEVATLFDGEGTAGFIIQAKFDATRLASGLYFARLQYDGKSMMKKMLLMK